MNILGLGGLLNDAACAVLKNGRLVSAVEQEKVARRLHPGQLPDDAIRAAMELAGIAPKDVDTVAIARPFSERKDSTLHLELRDRFPASHVVLVEHQLAHASSAYFASPFTEATVLTLDRSGDFRCGGRWRAAGSRLSLEREIYYPDSLGDLYSRVTDMLGFEPGAEEHKVQWLSASGDASLAPLFEEVLPCTDANWPRLERGFFDVNRSGRGGFSSLFYKRLGLADDAPIDKAMRVRLAAGLQQAVERAVLSMAGDAGDNLCLAGGLFLNALLIAALERSGRWKNVFVQPASGNAGTALGAILYAWHQVHQQSERIPFQTLNLGPSFDSEAIKRVLENCKLRFRLLLTTRELISATVERLAADQIVAWMQGRMEFGPRALGNRSLLASPLNPYSTENLNLYIKHREEFRKFAASVPAEMASTYFEFGPNARYLATVGRVRPEHRKTFESAVLGDGWVRVHTVDAAENPLFHDLLHAWGEKTGLPVLYNTSFNLFGDPMVCTPRDAVRSFYSCGVDSMLVGNFLLEK
jgi:carbamoyltransferase